MRKFDFKKSYEEIEIAGEFYKVSLKDEDRKKYSEQLKKFYDLVNKVNVVDPDEIAIDAALKLEEEFKEITLETLDVLFGDQSGQELYAASDEQTEELIPIVFAVAEIINERRQEKLGKYTKKKKVK
ncbi:hypothetical protein [Cytobacillus oceanisediminis]|uniref:hypothetical protein n=1 Tax=Cytobacillus oceanisediminis TaxID=665099 RepID=UPI00207B0747|nr:hypothetical protein [Cytobacillus oceanisediminis]USK43533.1 hypothetical protein LIT27_23580 [Cytobacillus oceanisediminis]